MKSLAKIVKPAKILLPLMILGASLLPNSAKAQRISFLNEISMGYNYNQEKIKVSNMPLVVRDVPKHPDDDYARDEDVAPIEDAPIEMNQKHSIANMKIGGKVSVLEDKLNLNFGVGANIELNAWSIQAIERNYTNAPGTSMRGTGAALTFYDIRPAYLSKKNCFFRPKFFSEIELINLSSPGASMRIGYEVYPEKLLAVNGWDRYNYLEVKDKYVLADLITGRPYLSIKVLSEETKNAKIYGEVIGGFIHVINKDFKNLAKKRRKETDIETGVGWFAGFNMVLEF